MRKFLHSKAAWAWLFLFLIGAIGVTASCSGGGGSPGTFGGPGLNSAPATVTLALEVPPALRQTPFDTTHSLTVPPGFGIKLWARVTGARFMALAPNGDVLVSDPGAGIITLLRPRGNDLPQSFIFASGLTKPHDMVFHQIGNVTYLYVAESDRVTRSVYSAGDTQSAVRETVVDNLPDASLPELRGTYFHEMKNIALSIDHKLYVSIASSCNACIEDTVSDPVRGAIYQYNADGSSGRLFARGLRNAEGLRFLPGTNTLWVTVNGRDQVLYPFNNDFDGDGQADLGKLLPAYVDNNPPEMLTQVRDGGNYGWPFCNPTPNAAMSDLDMVIDFETNADSSHLDCAKADRPNKGIQAHSAPLGMSFLQNSGVPLGFRNGAAVALHGCWNCTKLTSGYKVVFFPFDDNGNAGAEMDLVTGFVIDANARTYWGRPVDVIADASGNLLISDDFAGAIYQLHPQ